MAVLLVTGYKSKESVVDNFGAKRDAGFKFFNRNEREVSLRYMWVLRSLRGKKINIP